MGRPPKFETPEELERQIKSYFLGCAENNKVPTKGGLAIHLDTTRETLGDYENKDGFSDAIKKAYLLIEEDWVQLLGTKGSNTAGAIFYLKNAFKNYWKDKQETEHSGSIDISDKYGAN